MNTKLPVFTGGAPQRMWRPEERGLEHSQTWGPGDHPLAAGGRLFVFSFCRKAIRVCSMVMGCWVGL